MGGGLVLVDPLARFSYSDENHGRGPVRFRAGHDGGVNGIPPEAKGVVVHITNDATVIPLTVGAMRMQVIGVNPSRGVVRVAVGRRGEIPAAMRVRLPRRRSSRFPGVGELVAFDGLRVELMTVAGRCRVMVRADAVKAVTADVAA